MKYWIFPCNQKEYDIESAFNNLTEIEWRQNLKNIQIGDIVLIYLSSPIKEVKYICKVNEINLNNPKIDDTKYEIDKSRFEKRAQRYCTLKLLDKINSNLSYDKLKQLGLKSTLQNQILATDDIISSINDYIKDNEITNMTEEYIEGKQEKRFLTSRERNPKARKNCIDKYGYICQICGINLEKVYGPVGHNYIHVHHIHLFRILKVSIR